nr:His/Gly/Thr/Pro-type tRNA ligase C-terminal domain-containing protein [Burkholderiales bacterium]
PMNLTYLDQNGKSQLMEMGCYGIGVSRIIAAAIEQNNDEKGIIFPVNMAPFELIITSINYSKSTLVKTKSDELYIKLKNLNIDVLLDDRDERIGSLLADSELLGIPFRIVIGEKFLANNQVEFYNRKISASKLINLNDIVNIASELINLEKK